MQEYKYAVWDYKKDEYYPLWKVESAEYGWHLFTKQGEDICFRTWEETVTFIENKPLEKGWGNN